MKTPEPIMTIAATYGLAVTLPSLSSLPMSGSALWRGHAEHHDAHEEAILGYSGKAIAVTSSDVHQA